MTWQFTSDVIAFLFAAVVSCSIAVVILRRPLVSGSLTFVLLMLAVAEWTFVRALEGMAVEMPSKILWAKLEYPGIVTVPLLWFIFTVKYGRQVQWLTRRVIVLLLVVPCITFALALTNEAHGLIWSSILPGTTPGSNLIYNHGTWFWMHVVYSYALMLTGTGQLIRNIVRFPQLYRSQIGALLAGAAVPWIGNAIYILGLSPRPGLDLTPFAFAVSGVIYAFGVFRFQLFDLVPVARDAAIENLTDGVLVLDLQNRIVDINPAAKRLTGIGNEALGQNIEAIFADQVPLISRYRDVKAAQEEIQVGKENGRHWDLRIAPIYDSQQQYTGRLVVLRDITDRKRAEVRTQALLNTTSDLVLQYRSDGLCLASNHAQRDGQTAPPISVGKRVDEVMTPSLAQLTLDNIAQAIQTGEVQTYRYTLVIDGQEHFFEGRMEACAADEVIAIIRDVTERQRIENELRQVSVQLQKQSKQIEELQVLLHEQGIRDPVTGLFNRSYFAESLERELARATRAERPLSIVAIVIDHLKLVRDKFGNKASDLLLHELADLVREQSRLSDIACYLDDEFVIVLPSATADVAARRAEQWRANFETRQINYAGTNLRTTVSLGVAAFPLHGKTSDELMHSARQALTRAQELGHNRVMLLK